MKEVIIIGNGPAGISAALYTTRAGIKTTVIGRDGGALSKAHKIENYYGFTEAISGTDLIKNGIAQAKRLGAEIFTDEVVSIGYTDKLNVKTTTRNFHTDSIILSMGSSRQTPAISGLSEFVGRGVSYCATCDAFFYKGKDVAVLGCCEYALSEAMELLPVTRSVTLITNGASPIPNFPSSISINTKEIVAFSGDKMIESVLFKDGTTLSISGVFIAIGVAGSADLAKKIGARVNGNQIVVDEHMATTIPGIFAAGDCTGGLLQISKAVYEGALAGTEAVKYLRK